MILNSILGILALIVVGAIALQYQSLKQWLVWGVTQAEIYFGSSTGQLKLKYVYDLALVRYPLIAKLLPYTTFCKLVDLALEKMKVMIDSNESIRSVIEKKTE